MAVNNNLLSSFGLFAAAVADRLPKPDLHITEAFLQYLVSDLVSTVGSLNLSSSHTSYLKEMSGKFNEAVKAAGKLSNDSNNSVSQVPK